MNKLLFLASVLASIGGASAFEAPGSRAQRPKLAAWLATVGALTAAQRVRGEVMKGLEGWTASGRFAPIKEQVAANPQLKWVYP